MSSAAPAPRRKVTPAGRNMALLAAFLGWLFDGFEMGLFPLIGVPALRDLLPEADPVIITNWFSVIIATFLVGAATGGVLFGWLGDRIGRVRAMSLSIFTYAIFTGLCGFATEAWHIAVLRFVASLGMGGEWALGVALVNELWTKGNRIWVAGAIGAAANIGYLLVAILSLGLNSYVESWQQGFESMGMPKEMAESLFRNSGWRFLMISGAFPAVLIFFIRLFVPESEKWHEEKAAGNTSHWSNTDLYGVLLGGVSGMVIAWVWSPIGLESARLAGVVTVVGLGAVLYGYLFPVRRYLQRADLAGALAGVDRKVVIRHMLIGAGLAGVALLGTWGAAQQAPKWSSDLPANGWLHPREYTQLATSFGAILATFFMPLVADRFGRRLTYSMTCLLAFGSAVLFYKTNHAISEWFFVSAFIIGGVSASFYGFFPLYLPELFPTRVRATGQGFCFNVGRIVAAVGALQLANLVLLLGGTEGGHSASANAYIALCGVYFVGVALVWLAPETKGKPLQ
jgi:SHS family sialic acid transporter-like MFS transporter